MKPIVQISLDLTNIDEALETAEIAMRAGVDWLEAGTPLILAEGLHGVRWLRDAFPDTPIVADLKTMDGGYLEAEMMAKAGATHVVVMARAHHETIKCVVKAGADFGCKVMGDNMGPDEEVFASYEAEIHDIMRTRATAKLHTNVLQHAMGYLKEVLEPTEKREILAAIDDYRQGLLPLVVPISLLRYNIRRHDVEYLLGQLYFDPHPKELMLRNHA